MGKTGVIPPDQALRLWAELHHIETVLCGPRGNLQSSLPDPVRWGECIPILKKKRNRPRLVSPWRSQINALPYRNGGYKP